MLTGVHTHSTKVGIGSGWRKQVPGRGGRTQQSFYGLENEILLKHIIVTTAATVAKKAIAWRYVWDVQIE